MKVRATVGATEVTNYLKGYSVSPGAGGRIGTGSLYLDQEAGGMDLRVRQEVRLWVPHDQVSGDGVAQRGRLFHGLVAIRDTSNVGITKTWSLNCGDMNALNHLLVRDAQVAKQVTLSAGSFATQIATLVALIQSNGFGAPPKQIDASTGVVDFHPSMPAVTMEPGHKLGWYIQQLCAKVREMIPGTYPRFHVGMAQTFGAFDSFGQPVLYIYDGALSPSVTIEFSDTPTGAEKAIFPPFRRTTDGGGDRVIQRRQAYYGPEESLVVTALSTASQSTYPNEWMNHGQTGDTGFWMGEPMRYPSSNGTEAQALINAEVQKTANPGDALSWTTPELLGPYDVIGLKWDLEGIPDNTPYRVSQLTTADIRELNPVTTVTVNSRRRGLLDDGSDEWPLLPIEGDRVPPLAPANISLLAQVWDGSLNMIRSTVEVDPSPSPDTDRYSATVFQDGVAILREIIANIQEYVFYVQPDADIELRVWAIDTSGNRSLEYAVEAWTSIRPPVDGALYNPDFERVNREHPAKAAGWYDEGTHPTGAELTETNVKSGMRAYILPSGGTGQATTVVSTPYPWAENGLNWYFRVWRRAKSGTPRLTAKLQLYREGDSTPWAEIFFEFQQTGISGSWEQNEYYPPYPNTFVPARVELVFTNDSPAASELVIDAVEWFAEKPKVRNSDDSAEWVVNGDGSVSQWVGGTEVFKIDSSGNIVTGGGGGISGLYVQATPPSGHVADRWWLETDTGLVWWDDGTYWLGPEIVWPLKTSDTDYDTYSATAAPIRRRPAPGPYKYLCKGIRWNFRPNGTNTLGNNWTLQSFTESNTLGGTGQGNISTVGFSGNFNTSDQIPSSPEWDFSNPSGFYTIGYEVIKNGSPGTLDVMNVSAVLRRIYV